MHIEQNSNGKNFLVPSYKPKILSILFVSLDFFSGFRVKVLIRMKRTHYCFTSFAKEERVWARGRA